MTNFFFEGTIPSSKSLYNRALIIQSYFPQLEILGASLCEDVQHLETCLTKISTQSEFHAGDGGTTLRFLVLRLSRLRGRWKVHGSAALFKRPQSELIDICQQLGVEIKQEKNALEIISSGWKQPADSLHISNLRSSQFASAVLLNCWDLDFDLKLSLEGETSESYWHMTVALCQELGLQIEEVENSKNLKIKRGQKIIKSQVSIEPDMSSAFAVAALAALHGEARFHHFPQQSLQPDFIFVELLRCMGAEIERLHEETDSKTCLLVVKKPKKSLLALEQDLATSPDLMPVLSVLCAFAEGKSVLFGAPQLRYKESDRISTVTALLHLMQVKCEAQSDGLAIEGQPRLSPQAFTLDPHHDHRLVMAAGLLRQGGWPVKILSTDVVKKSFPEYLELIPPWQTLLIGHRGTGKSTFLKRVEKIQKMRTYDLDEEISHKLKKTIPQIFKDEGVEYFRQQEQLCLNEIITQSAGPAFIALGAGFELDQLKITDQRILWLRRETDAEGRVFVDRPRLSPEEDALQEYLQFFPQREEKYEKFASQVYTLPEGLSEDVNKLEQEILFYQKPIFGAVTLLSKDVDGFVQKGAKFYELRDDLLTEREVKILFYKIPQSKVIYSCRKSKKIPRYILNSKCRLDWALELGPPPAEIEACAERVHLSTHQDFEKSLSQLKAYENSLMSLKLCPFVESWDQLKLGHEWFLKNPGSRTFLPRSKNGRWIWYRLYCKKYSSLQFWREGHGSALDQPTKY